MHNENFEQSIDISNSSVEGSQFSQAQRDSIQNQASFQGNNNNHITNVWNTLVGPSLEEVTAFLNQSFKSLGKAIKQNDYHKDIISLKREQIQNEIDYHYWPFNISRSDICDLFLSQTNKLLVLPAPPQISVENPFSTHFESIRSKNEYKLDILAKKYYALSSRNNTVLSDKSDSATCLNVFKEPIDKAHAFIFCKNFSGIPLLILNSQINYDEVYIYVTMTSPMQEINSSEEEDKKFVSVDPVQFSLAAFNWREVYNSLKVDHDHHECIKQILDAIVTMHEAALVWMSDLYCLRKGWNYDSYHDPHFFKYFDEKKTPDYLKSWLEPFHQSLLRLSDYIQAQLLKKEKDKQEQLHREQQKTYQEETVTHSGQDGYGAFLSLLGMIGGIILASLLLSLATGSQPQKLDADQEQSYLNDLNNAIEHWDIQTSQRSISYLRRSEDPCVSNLAIMLQRSLNHHGAEGFRNFEPIKNQLSNQFGCEF
ncbi:hypothetical protein [Phormidium sp. FACHB-1136]|uniref:hypothetical protein n=1 Tax=Phormidium sp. FACHB-1136 TaxID=2692848 RepID=UPI00168989C5|nr:hypothetical protein [Phormidium sp. FACHB-1136]MBD2425000.1 hypothetical protein [Phormidium sp. FACHB-1136]